MSSETLTVWICCKPWQLTATSYTAKKTAVTTTSNDDDTVDIVVYIVPNGCTVSDYKFTTKIVPLDPTSSVVTDRTRTLYGDGVTTTYKLRLSYTPIVRGSIVIKVNEIPIGSDDASVSAIGNITGTGISGTINYNGGILYLNFSPAVSSGIPIEIDYKSEDSRIIIPSTLTTANRELQCLLDDYPLKWRETYIETTTSFTLKNEIIFYWDSPEFCSLKRVSLYYEDVMVHPARKQITARRYYTDTDMALKSQEADFDTKENNLCIVGGHSKTEVGACLVPGSRWFWTMNLQNYPTADCGDSDVDDEGRTCHLGTEITMGQVYFGTKTYTGGIVKACCLTTGETGDEGYEQQITQYNESALPNNWVGSRMLRWIILIEGQRWIIMPMGFESYTIGNWACVIKLSLPNNPYAAKSSIDNTTLTSDDYNEVFATGKKCVNINEDIYGVVYYHPDLRVVPNNFYGGYFGA